MKKEKIIELEGKRFKISEMSFVDGRRVEMNYVTTILPRVGDYEKNEALLPTIFKYAWVEVMPDKWLNLDSMELVEQHCSYATAKAIEREVVDMTLGFFDGGKLESLWEKLVESLGQELIKILMSLSEESYRNALQALENSKSTTP